MENGETSQQGAARETMEEACARVEVEGLYTLFNLPQINQVYLLFRSQLVDLDFAPGEESLEVALFDEKEIPWDRMAFPVIKESLKLYYSDREAGDYPLRGGTIIRSGDSAAGYQVVLDSP
jgi:ADP-ribose pyrophosphatase YjhB (NUDIX family)